VTGALAIFSLAIALLSCKQSAPEPVTLNYLRPGFRQMDPTWELLSQQFTRETGIRLKDLPPPESTLDQLDLSRKLLQEGGGGADVLGVDLIWSGALEEDLLDLRQYLAAEISSLDPRLMPSYTIDGKVVAIPYRVQAGVLEYRTDLLRAYGYDHPPQTWDELERMAARIQAGERAKGRRDFWGYVWQGAETEALTCNALEWQIAEGGGRIIENDRTISVNNPAAIRSWLRAKHWIGWISPPSVLAYRESDTMNVLDSGGAAFGRVWGRTAIIPGAHSRLLYLRGSLAIARTGYTSIPGGPGGWAGTLGGAGLAVPRHAAHPQEAIDLVRFLVDAGIRSSGQGEGASPPAHPEFYDLPSLSNPTGPSGKASGYGSGLVTRPSNEAGRGYEQVTRAYIHAVHSVLTGERGAPQAATELEKQLTRITGFSVGPPKPPDQSVR
jgi:trehalose/maltose transport system substrate-binding protein